MFEKSFDIEGLSLGGNARCVVIAEAGVAHFGSVEKALRLVDLALESGADIFKMQHFDPDHLVSRSAGAWYKRMASRALRDIDIKIVKEYCDHVGIRFMCTAHDEKSLLFLDQVLNISAFKVGSGEIENWGFIKDVFSRGKPVILSLGMYESADVRSVIDLAGENGCSKLALLHCVTQYPTPPSSASLRTIEWLFEQFEGPVGYSDHTAGTEIALAALVLGAKIIEKHIALDFDIPDAQDWKVSCGPNDFGKFIESIRNIETALSRPAGKAVDEGENQSRVWARKSIAFSSDLPSGHTIRNQDLKMIRPGEGLSPAALPQIVGRTLRKMVTKDSFASLDDVY